MKRFLNRLQRWLTFGSAGGNEFTVPRSFPESEEGRQIVREVEARMKERRRG